MRDNIAVQTHSTYKRRVPQVPSATIALAFTLSISHPIYTPALHDRAQLKDITDIDDRPGTTTSVASTFVTAASDYERQITARLADLLQAAHDDQSPWSQDSAEALTNFLSFHPKQHRPMIVLTDAGNLAAIWEEGRDRQITLQFIGPDLVQYTMLALRPGSPIRSHTTGRDTVSGALQHIKAMGLAELLTA